MTIVEAIVFQYVKSSEMAILGWAKGVMIKKLKLTDPMISSVLAATIGTETTPCREIRLEPMLGFTLDKRATPLPTISLLDQAYVGTMSKSSLTFEALMVVKTMGSVLMLS